jgi:prepilin-type N-terminal cleavage/methylation domain-containing protein
MTKRVVFTQTPNRAAFTLVELLVVIAIIGLLSTIAVVSTTSARVKAHDTKMLADKNQIIKALNFYNIDNGGWPSSGGNWSCFGASTGESCWVGIYHGLDSLKTAMAPYMANFPTTGVDAGTGAYNRYLYNSNTTAGGQTGAFLIWPKENTMTSSECAGAFGGHIDKYWYCYEYLGS